MLALSPSHQWCTHSSSHCHGDTNSNPADTAGLVTVARVIRIRVCKMCRDQETSFSEITDVNGNKERKQSKKKSPQKEQRPFFHGTCSAGQTSLRSNPRDFARRWCILRSSFRCLRQPVFIIITNALFYLHKPRLSPYSVGHVSEWKINLRFSWWNMLKFKINYTYSWNMGKL